MSVAGRRSRKEIERSEQENSFLIGMSYEEDTIIILVLIALCCAVTGVSVSCSTSLYRHTHRESSVREKIFSQIWWLF